VSTRRVAKKWDRFVWFLLNQVDDYAHRRGVRQAEQVRRERGIRRLERSFQFRNGHSKDTE
jgi:hypothetical protein